MSALLLCTNVVLLVGWAHAGGWCVRRALRRWGDVGAPEAELTGLGLLSLLGFAACAIGFTPIAEPRPVEAIIAQPFLGAVFAVVGAIGAILAVARLRPALSRLVGWSGAERLALVSIAGIWCYLLGTTLVPEFRIDESMYHLLFPLQQLRAGALVAIEGHGNSGFPAFGEMLSFWPLALGSIAGARAVQLVVVLVGLRCALSLLPFARLHVLVGFGLFLLTPTVFWIAPSTHIDVLQSIYEVVSLLLITTRGLSPANLVVAGFLTGCAAASKYTALAQIPFFILVVLVMQARAGMGLRSSARGLIGAGVALGLPVLPYVLRNIAFWGNPLFPFAAHWFGGGLLPEQHVVLDEFMRHFGPLDGNAPIHGPFALLRLPLDLFFRARPDTFLFDGAIGALGPLVLLLALLTRGRSPPIPGILVAHAVFKTLVWLSTSWQMRFFVGVQWMFCLAAPVLCARLATPWLRRMGAAAIGAWCVWALSTALPPAHAWDARMFLGRGAEHALRLERHALSGACDALPVGAHVMLVWSQRLAFWCAARQHADSYDEWASLRRWLQSGGAEGALAELQRRGITHLLVDEESLYAVPSEISAGEMQRLEQDFAAYRALSGKLSERSRVETMVLYEVPVLPLNKL